MADPKTQIVLSADAMAALNKTAKHYERAGKPGESFLGSAAAQGYATLQESGDQTGGVYMERGFKPELDSTGAMWADPQRAMEGRAVEMRQAGNRTVAAMDRDSGGAYSTQFRGSFGTVADMAMRAAIEQSRADEATIMQAGDIPRPRPVAVVAPLKKKEPITAPLKNQGSVTALPRKQEFVTAPPNLVSDTLSAIRGMREVANAAIDKNRAARPSGPIATAQEAKAGQLMKTRAPSTLQERIMPSRWSGNLTGIDIPLPLSGSLAIKAFRYLSQRQKK